ncbi:MAG: hypothetical protein IKR19_08930 [Acholeplasmatales bacterium]|nr:hypothetical protein [Acholeplasmatales bacterium]
MEIENKNNIIKEYLDIISDIEIHDHEKGSILSWIYRHTLYNYYKKKIRKSIDLLDNIVLMKDDVQELIYFISNTFASENGQFYQIVNAKSLIFEENTKSEYTMYSAILKLGNSYAELKAYSNNPNIEVIYHDNIVDIHTKSSTFTFYGERLIVEESNQYRRKCILDVNNELVDIMRKYLLYCLDGEEGE